MKTRRSVPRFIIFLGPVGVGKTTLAELLRSSLSKRGVRVKITFLKAFHGISFMLWVLVARILYYERKTRNHKHYAPWLYVSRINEKLAWKLTLIIAVIDMLLSIPLKLLYIELLKRLYDVVICEEYLFGTVSDYLFTLLRAKGGRGSSVLRFSTKLYLSTLLMHIQKNVVVFLDANFHTLISRWNTRGYGDPQRIYISYQKLLLKKLIELIKAQNIDICLVYIDTSNKDVRSSLSELMSMLTLVEMNKLTC